MLSRDTRAELCCFAATCCGIAAFLLILFSLDLMVQAPLSKARDLLLVGAGIAFVLMIILTALAVEMERNRGG